MKIENEIIQSVLQTRREDLAKIVQGSREAGRSVAERISHCLGLTPMITLVMFERCKQVIKGYDAKHDDMHTLGQLTMGAVCFAQTAFTQINSAKPLPKCFRHKDWPWEPSSFHAEEDPVGNLVKAAAMLIAEAGRIERSRGDEEGGAVPADDMFLSMQIRAGINLAIKRDKIGQFLAAVSGYVQAVLCEVEPERLEEALKSIETFDLGQSQTMDNVQRSIAAWVRAEMALLHDPAYQDLQANAEDAKLTGEGGVAS